MKQLSDQVAFLQDIATKAGELLLTYFQAAGQPTDVKADNSPVTAADFAVNRMVIEEVKKHYPDYGVLGEEESSLEGRSKLFVVDPLDGTRMFAMGSPLFCFAAAVVEAGVPVAGIITNPLANRTLVAETGKGAYLVETGQTVRVNEQRSLEGALVNAGWDKKWGFMVEELYQRGARTLQLYSIAEVASLIATGGLAGEVYLHPYAHDVAAAKVIVEEAGGKVTDIFGANQSYDQPVRGAILSNGYIHDELLDAAKASGLGQKFVSG